MNLLQIPPFQEFMSIWGLSFFLLLASVACLVSAFFILFDALIIPVIMNELRDIKLLRIILSFILLFTFVSLDYLILKIME